MALPGGQPFVKYPPTGWLNSLRSIGPGVIIVGTIVGSGELVTTTLLGAKVGFVVLWLVIVSCLVKVIIQEQWAYYVITSGGTLLDATSFLPGPRVRGLSLWTWLLFLYFILNILPAAGVVGMAATTAALATGVGSVSFWALALTALTILFLWFGTYARIEKLFISMVALFSLSMCVALALTQSTQLAIRWSELISGLRFELPSASMYIALSAFGITGIAAPEIIFYTYWCLEKGYGRYIGPPEETPEWRERARGWIAVMRRDIMVSAATYTLITIVFYLLGAAILHRTQPDAANLEGLDVALALSKIFTESFGQWSFVIFMTGAFLVLYSTFVAACASWARFSADFSKKLGLISATDPAQWDRSCRWLSISLAAVFLLAFLFLQTPVGLILFGGILHAVFLPLLGFSVIYLFHKRGRQGLTPGSQVRVISWICSVIILAVVICTLYLQKGGG